MHTLLLSTHLIGAGYTGIVLIQSVVALLKNYTDTYQSLAHRIAGTLVLQIVSGCILIVESHSSLSTLGFCKTFSLYFVPIVAIEAILFFRMNQDLIEKFPLAYVTQSFFLSLFIAIGTMLV